MTARQLKLLEKNAAREKEVMQELAAILGDIERCEKTIADLQRELSEVNTQFQGPRTTQQDVDYLTALLGCAKKKLVWEKHISILRKRTTATLETMSALVSDPQAAPAEETRAEMLHMLQKVQAAMDRLSAANLG